MTVTGAPSGPPTPLRPAPGDAPARPVDRPAAAGSGSPADPSERVRRRAARALLALLLGAVATLGYAATAVARHRQFLTAQDLGYATEAVRGYARLEAPLSSLKAAGEFNLLGDHFHPVYALLAPLYALWPSPEALLVGQAALLGAAVAVVCHGAATVLDDAVAGLLLGAGFAVSWGVLSAAIYDVHEVAFAAPVLAVSLVAFVRRRYRLAAGSSLLLLLVKEDQFLTVAALGLALVVVGRRRLGLALAAVAVAAGLLTVGWVVPALAWNGRYRYLEGDGTGEGAAAQLAAVAERAGSPEGPWVVVVAGLATVLGLCLRSPLLLLAVPMVGLRFVSDRPSTWGLDFHYGLTLMPVVFVAAVDALRRRLPGPRSARTVRRALAAGVLVASAGVSVGTGNWFVEFLRAPPCERCDAAQRVLDRVPDGATVGVDPYLSPHLVERARPHKLNPDLRDATGAELSPGYLVVDLAGVQAPEWQALVRRLTDPAAPARSDLRYHRLTCDEGYCLLEQAPPAGPL